MMTYMSQAAAYDVNFYTISYNYQSALPGTIALNGRRMDKQSQGQLRSTEGEWTSSPKDIPSNKTRTELVFFKKKFRAGKFRSVAFMYISFEHMILLDNMSG